MTHVPKITMLVAFLLGFPSSGSSQVTPSKEPSIRLPEVDQTLVPPISKAVNVLKSGELYVFDSDVPVMLFISPDGLVSVEEEAGPMKVHGLFAGNTKRSVRTFKGQQVFTLQAVASGTCELIITPVGAKKPGEVIRRTIRVEAGQGPQPPPDIDPVTPVKPAPIAGDGLRVLIVYNKDANLTKEQHGAIYGNDIRAYLNRKTPVGADGKTHEWRIYPAGLDVSGDSKTWQDAYARPRGAMPWIIVSNGKTGEEVPIVSIEETMKLLKKYGGE